MELDALFALEGLAAATAGMAALGYIYKRVVRPLARTLVLMEEAIPVLADISHEFRNNSGSTLKDHIDKVTGLGESTQHEAAQTRTVLNLYVHSTDKRLLAMQETLDSLNQAVVALTTPQPRKPRKAPARAVETSDPKGGTSRARS